MASSTLKKEEEAILAKDPEVPNSDPSKSLSPVKGDSKEPSLPTPSPTKKTPGPSEPSTKSKHSSELSLPALDGVKDQPKIPVSARSQPFPGPRKNQVRVINSLAHIGLKFEAKLQTISLGILYFWNLDNGSIICKHFSMGVSLMIRHYWFG